MMIITPHEKSEWIRMADDAKAKSHHDAARRMTDAASKDILSVQEYDAIMTEYRDWLVFDQWHSNPIAS